MTAHALLLSLSNHETKTDLTIVSESAKENTDSVPNEQELLAYAEAVVARDAGAIKIAAEKIRSALGDEALVDSAAVISHFDAINRVADAAGIELDRGMTESTAEMRDQLGFNRFDTHA